MQGNSHWWAEDNRTAEEYGPLIVSIPYTVKEFCLTIVELVYYFVLEIVKTIFSAKNFGVTFLFEYNTWFNNNTIVCARVANKCFIVKPNIVFE